MEKELDNAGASDYAKAFVRERAKQFAKLDETRTAGVLEDIKGKSDNWIERNLPGRIRQALTKSAAEIRIGEPTFRILSSADFEARFGRYAPDAVTILRKGKNGQVDVEIVSRAELSEGVRIQTGDRQLSQLPQIHSAAKEPVQVIGTGDIPSLAELEELVSKKMDFSTTEDGAIFWSTPNMEKAQGFGLAVGKTTLEQTTGGKQLDAMRLFRVLPAEQAAHIWDMASVRFAKGASGTVNTFLEGSEPLGPHGLRTWWRIELPLLLKNSSANEIRMWYGSPKL